MTHGDGGRNRHPSVYGRFLPALPIGAILALILTACGAGTPTVTPAPQNTAIVTATRPAPSLATGGAAATARVTPAATASAPLLITAAPASATAAPTAASRRGLPDRLPDQSAGVRSDGWVLDGIEAQPSGGQVAFIVRFQPLPGATGGPQTDVWFEMGDETFIIAVQGVRGANVVLRPNAAQPVNMAPLKEYRALPVRDDALYALAVTTSGPPGAWTLTSDAPGIVRLTVAGK